MATKKVPTEAEVRKALAQFETDIRAARKQKGRDRAWAAKLPELEDDFTDPEYTVAFPVKR